MAVCRVCPYQSVSSADFDSISEPSTALGTLQSPRDGMLGEEPKKMCRDVQNRHAKTTHARTHALTHMQTETQRVRETNTTQGPAADPAAGVAWRGMGPPGIECKAATADGGQRPTGKVVSELSCIDKI